MKEKAFCQKDNCEIELEKGCRHPNDYCQFRQACIVHFLERQRKREKRETGKPDEAE